MIKTNSYSTPVQEFDFSTTKNVSIVLNTKDGHDNGVSNVVFSILNDNSKIGNGMTDESGEVSLEVVVPAYLDSITVYTTNIFYYGSNKLPIINNKVEYSYDSFGQFTSLSTSSSLLKKDVLYTDYPDYEYVCEYYRYGGIADSYWSQVPNSMLRYINNNLPEGNGDNINNENILDGNANLVFKKDANVTITFISEGTEYLNALGYYTYEEGNQPSDVDEIEKHKIVFPCISQSGVMWAGQTVSLGSRSAGDVMGWFLVSNGWVPYDYDKQQGAVVDDGEAILYSNSNLNPGGLKQSILLPYTKNDDKKIIMAFEDIARDESVSTVYDSDSDFNDVLFYITIDPADAVEYGEEVIEDPDMDGDGVDDINDAYPDDASKAFDNVTTGTLAYEDLWPSKGDYDFNDLVLGYSIDQITNAENKISEICIDLLPIAAGAQYNNGFGIEIGGLLSDNVSSVSGDFNITNDIEEYTTSKNGYFTIIPFNGVKNLFDATTDYINTKWYPVLAADTLSFVIELETPVGFSDIGEPPYNSFLIIKGEKEGDEVHLVSQKIALGETDEDISYKDENNMPWALNMPVEFDYPVEDIDIREVFYMFDIWAGNSGNSYSDWYEDKSGYRNSSKTFTQKD